MWESVEELRTVQVCWTSEVIEDVVSIVQQITVLFVNPFIHWRYRALALNSLGTKPCGLVAISLHNFGHYRDGNVFNPSGSSIGLGRNLHSERNRCLAL